MARIHLLPFLASLFFVLISPQISQAQDKCGVVAYEQLLQQNNPNRENQQVFEQWMQKKLTVRGLSLFQTNKVGSTTYTIPVVVHVIHNGESVGVGTNISDAQIQSQIDVLNNDYKRLNSDNLNTPTEFQPVASSLDVLFVLAKQDPEGLATKGITRTKGTKTSWTITDNSEFKGLAYWPAENYLNIWVVNLSGGLIGYSQLPISTQLPGLESASADRLTDGVAIHYQTFGAGSSFSLIPNYSLGRTATHEIGHFFGLRHIWGDNNCGTDYVDDTPFQTTSTSGCPTNPQASCDTRVGYPHKMFQNYMDYSNDACMNLFTVGQVGRMQVILGNSPRRLSLLTSPGINPPAPATNDLGIRQIVSPVASACNTPIVPQVIVRNYGTNKIDSATLKLSLDGVVVETKTFFGLALDTLHVTTLNFKPLSFSASSIHQVNFNILRTNGNNDLVTSNNTATVQVQVPLSLPLPISEPFATTPTGWNIINPDGLITWANVLAADNNPTNKAMYVNFHAYENLKELDWLVTPSFNIGTLAASQLRFDVAYAQYPNQTADGLRVYALPGCSTDLSQALLIYDKSGASLATAPSSKDSFAPTSDAQWRKSEVVSLTSLNTSTTWQLAFVSQNGYGNNLYLDNVVVTDKIVNDIALAQIVSPALVHCSSSVGVQFSVRNLSSSTITSFQASYSLNGSNPVIQTFPTSMNVGEVKTFTLNTVALQYGANQFSITLANPNQLPDADPSNNSIVFNSYFDPTADTSPARETFDSNLEIPWLKATPYGATPWKSAQTNKLQSVVYTGFTNTTIGEESWVTSPVLDLSHLSHGSLLFDLSYARRSPATERIRVMASDDCGLTYKTILWDQSASDLTSATSTSEWVPKSDSDWKRQYVNLDALAGKKNIRLAVIATNGNGNDLYIDNLELFVGDDSNPPITSATYQLYYSTRESRSDLALTFNLPEKKDVRLQIFNLMGQLVADNMLPGTLNQTYYFDLSIQAAGLYIFRLQIDNQYSATRVFIGH